MAVVASRKRVIHDFEGYSVDSGRMQVFRLGSAAFALKREEFLIGETGSALLKFMGFRIIVAGFTKAFGKS